MGALPKHKITSSRRGHRRSQWKLKPKQLVTCPQCGVPVRPHQVCPACGTYRGVQVIEIEKE